MIDTTRWLKAKEVAEMITYSEDTLRRWRNEGYGPPWTRMKGDHGRGEIRYPESGVEEFMRKGYRVGGRVDIPHSHCTVNKRRSNSVLSGQP